MTNTEKLQKMYDESDYVVFFGGAGVSTESGIPDFRSADGLYNMHYLSLIHISDPTRPY